MKHTIKAILLFFTAALLISSCSSDDPTPPKAGFTLDPSDVIQWDTSLVVDTSTGSDVAATYTVTGGEFIYLGNTIQFLEAKSYTITQTVENEDGIDTFAQTVVVGTPPNEYLLDGESQPITTNAYWFDASAFGGTIYIRIVVPVSGQDNPNLVKLYPVAGPDPLQGIYTWGADGDPRTYDAGMTANWDGGFGFDWYTDGDDGLDMEIKLIYTDPLDDSNNIYEIVLTSYTLNYGNFDVDFNFVIEGTKELAVYYRGKIDPIDE